MDLYKSMGLHVVHVEHSDLRSGNACYRDSNNDGEQPPFHDSQNSEEGYQDSGTDKILNQEASPTFLLCSRRRLRKGKQDKREAGAEQVHNILKSYTTKDDCSTHGEHAENKIIKLKPKAQIMSKHLVNNILYQWDVTTVLLQPFLPV
jgi:hypothetical protein